MTADHEAIAHQIADLLRPLIQAPEHEYDCAGPHQLVREVTRAALQYVGAYDAHGCALCLS